MRVSRKRGPVVHARSGDRYYLSKQPASAEIKYELNRKRIKSGIVKNPRSVPLRHRAEQR